MSVNSQQFGHEINIFLNLVRASGAKTALEIGCADCGTSAYLLNAMGEGSLLVGVDLKDPAQIPEGAKFVRGASTSYHTQSDVFRALEGRKVDVLFIDAEHTEAAAMADYETYKGLLSKNGMTAFHDITSFELWPMWNLLRGARPWNRSVEIIEDITQLGCGIGVLLGG